MRSFVAFGIILAGFVAGTVQAQQANQGPRISGTVKSATVTDVIVSTANGDVDIAITPQTRVRVHQAADASEIKAGSYLGTANQDGNTAGTGTATEVHLTDNGPNVNSPMNNSGLTMTNGHVKAVTSTSNGKEMDVDYGEARTRHVVVGKDTPITRLVDVGVAGLTPGVAVTATTTSATDGKPTASSITIGAPGAK